MPTRATVVRILLVAAIAVVALIGFNMIKGKPVKPPTMPE